MKKVVWYWHGLYGEWVRQKEDVQGQWTSWGRTRKAHHFMSCPTVELLWNWKNYQ